MKCFSQYGLIIAILIGVISITTLSHAQNNESPFTKIYDTGKHSPAPYSSETIRQKENWVAIPVDQNNVQFQGDAVLLNNRIALVFRSNASGVELYSKSASGYHPRAILSPAADSSNLKLSTIKTKENNESIGSIEAFFEADSQRLSITFELNVGQTFIHTLPGEGMDKLDIQAVSRFVVLPDFFADDIVIDARQLQVAKADLPSENFLLQFLGDGDAVLMSVCNTMEQDIAVTLAGQGNNRSITNARIHYGQEGEIWVAVLDEPGVWHTVTVGKEDEGKIIDLDWDIPFPAQWRVDWQCTNQLTDSWEMLVQQNDGTYFKYGWMGRSASFGQEDWLRKTSRQRWTTVLGLFPYPCWIDNKGNAHLQPLEKNVVQFAGPALIYPIARVSETPLNQFTVLDLVRETLGVGPCEYILDIEGQKSSYKGIATCEARTKLNEIYSKRTQKQDKEKINEHLDDVLAFMKHIRGRIQEYIDFSHDMQDYLKQQKDDHPELSGFLTNIINLIQEIDRSVARRQSKIHTPAYAEELVNTFRKTLIDNTSPDALDQCKKLTAGFVEIGGNQDELVGECRMAVKLLRQRAGIEMAKNPEIASISQEIRERTQAILRNPVSYEAPRH